MNKNDMSSYPTTKSLKAITQLKQVIISLEDYETLLKENEELRQGIEEAIGHIEHIVTCYDEVVQYLWLNVARKWIKRWKR